MCEQWRSDINPILSVGKENRHSDLNLQELAHDTWVA
jgi:hypothetical protein